MISSTKYIRHSTNTTVCLLGSTMFVTFFKDQVIVSLHHSNLHHALSNIDINLTAVTYHLGILIVIILVDVNDCSIFNAI